MNSLETINGWTEEEARRAFLQCCGAAAWANDMTSRRPFADESALGSAAHGAFARLDRRDWLEAFAAHPKIGDIAALRARFAATAAWSAQEQAGVTGSSESVLQDLAEGNQAYERKFGHIFIVCATGKSAEQMSTLLQARLTNDPETELRMAAAEQTKITELRLQKLLDSMAAK